MKPNTKAQARGWGVCGGVTASGGPRSGCSDPAPGARAHACAQPAWPPLPPPLPPAYLVRSGPGWSPKPDGGSEGAAATAGPSGGCSGSGEGRGAAASSAGGGAGGCMVGGAQDAFLPADEPRRATQDVSMTLTPMLARDTKTAA